MKLKKKAFYRLSAMLFLFILAVVFIVNLLTPDKKTSAAENRVLQTLPSFSVSEYFSGRLKTKLENYVNDQFAGRNWLIKVKTSSDMTEGVLISNGVIRCKNHYLMEELTAPEEPSFTETKKAVQQFKEKHSNVDMYFLLAPNAANILSSKLPATVVVNDQNQLMDSFFSELESFNIQPVDVRKALKKASKTEQVYYLTDHHWTTAGAYAAFSAAADVLEVENNIKYKPYAVKNNFRGTLYSTSGFTNGKDDAITLYLPSSQNNYHNSVYFFGDTQEKTTEYYKKDYLKKKDAYAVFGGSNHPYFTIDTPVESEDVLLLLKDSYANCMIPFLSQVYRRIIVVDPRYYFDNLDTVMESEGVTKVLFLYNANSFFEDTTLRMALTQSAEETDTSSEETSSSKQESSSEESSSAKQGVSSEQKSSSKQESTSEETSSAKQKSSSEETSSAKKESSSEQKSSSKQESTSEETSSAKQKSSSEEETSSAKQGSSSEEASSSKQKSSSEKSQEKQTAA